MPATTAPRSTWTTSENSPSTTSSSTANGSLKIRIFHSVWSSECASRPPMISTMPSSPSPCSTCSTSGCSPKYQPVCGNWPIGKLKHCPPDRPTGQVDDRSSYWQVVRHEESLQSLCKSPYDRDELACKRPYSSTSQLIHLLVTSSYYFC